LVAGGVASSAAGGRRLSRVILPEGLSLRQYEKRLDVSKDWWGDWRAQAVAPTTPIVIDPNAPVSDWLAHAAPDLVRPGDRLVLQYFDVQDGPPPFDVAAALVVLTRPSQSCPCRQPPRPRHRATVLATRARRGPPGDDDGSVDPPALEAAV